MPFKVDSARPPKPPLKFDLDDLEPYRHLKRNNLVDGATRSKVNGHTTLATLYKYNDPAVDNRLVANFAGIVDPKVPCQIQVGQGRLFPPTTAVGEHGYRLHFTYNKLALAPVVRIEFKITDAAKIQISILGTCALEFHFNKLGDDEDNAIRDYVHDVLHNTLTFDTGRATCSGYNLVAQLALDHPEKYQEVSELLKSFLFGQQRHTVTLHLDEDSLLPEQKTDLDRVRARLPGGGGHLIKTIGNVEYKVFGPHMDKIASSQASLLPPRHLMDGTAPHPWVPLQCGNTFSTVKEAAVQLAYSAAIAEEESYQAIKLWEKTLHECQIYLLENFAVLALNFKKFDTLGKGDRNLQFQLPRDIYCDFSIPIPEKTNSLKLKGFLTPSHPGGGVPNFKAYFQITSHTLEYFRDFFENALPPKFDSVGCTTHKNSFTHTSQLAAVRDLQIEENARWHTILLNQVHDVLETVEITASADPVLKRQADVWLLNWMAWNAEQLEVIEGIRAAKGGMIVVMGPAGTGKTLLQRALAIYFYSLGFHILSLAPANDNCNKMATDMRNTQHGLPMDVEFLRLFPGSRDMGLEEMSDKQRKQFTVGHEDGSAIPFRELLIALDECNQEKEPHRRCDVVHAVIRAADEGKLRLSKEYKATDGSRVPGLDAWDVLRELIKNYRDDNVDWLNTHDMEKYRAMYLACKGHIVSLNRFMITTTGNVRAHEMMNYWFSMEEDYGVERKGVIVFVDEAAKDLEINVWSGIVCKRWAAYVKGVFLFGDDKQLTPTNTSARGEIQFNFYRDRLDIPLSNRMVSEGFPCYYLKEQRRMHTALLDFPNHKVYGGMLRQGPGMDVSLDSQAPGLPTVLTNILAREFDDPINSERFKTRISDESLRRHYVQVLGERIEHPSTKSKAVIEHSNVFFSKIYPDLVAYFKSVDKSMKKEVMIICAYNHQRGLYLDRFQELRDAYPELTVDDIPRVMTIDSAQGDESFMVILDGSAQHGDTIGHLGEQPRFNVAVTRAKGVLWTIGGQMENRKRRVFLPANNLATQYRIELGRAQQVREFR